MMHHNGDPFAYPGPVLNGRNLVRRTIAACVLVTMTASASCSVERAGTPTEADLGITPTMAPTATAEPTPTAAPTATPTPIVLDYDALFDRLDVPEMVSAWEVPIAHCDAVGDPTSPDTAAQLAVPRGVSAIRCVEGAAASRPTGVVQAVADARIVQIGQIDSPDDEAQTLTSVLKRIEDDTDSAIAQWVDDGLLGNHIVLDIDLPAQAEVDPPVDLDTTGPDEAATLGPQVPPYRRSDPELDETPDPPPTKTPTIEPTPTSVEPTETESPEPTGTESATPAETTATGTPDDTTPTGTPGDTTPTGTPDDTTPTETPGDTTPTETPGDTTPTETPGDTTPTGTPDDTTPTGTPDDTTPTGTPGETSPEVTSIQVVYGAIDADFQRLKLGERVRAGDILGSTGADGTLLFGVWVNGIRQDEATAIATKAPGKNRQQRIADNLGDVILPPTSPECGLVKSQGRIPGAPREYRHGFHQGIDFVCTGADNEVTAVADGTVVYVIDDYDDASVENRNALLGRAVPAGNTPYWTLAMLYGNVVVIDHGDIEDVGRVVTISAHLDSVEDDVKLGATVSQDQVIGIVGTTGTNASADGLPNEDDPGQHLHWELFIDNWYLGQGLTPPEVQEIIVDAVCEDGSPDCDED